MQQTLRTLEMATSDSTAAKGIKPQLEDPGWPDAYLHIDLWNKIKTTDLASMAFARVVSLFNKKKNNLFNKICWLV